MISSFPNLVPCAAMPEDELLIVGDPGQHIEVTDPSGETRIVTLRPPSAVRITGIGAIEPTSIDKVSAAQKFGIDMPSAKPEWEDEFLRPSKLMRMLGYTAHPATCTHYRKRLMLGSTQWTCSDCGVNL